MVIAQCLDIVNIFLYIQSLRLPSFPQGNLTLRNLMNLYRLIQTNSIVTSHLQSGRTLPHILQHSTWRRWQALQIRSLVKDVQEYTTAAEEQPARQKNIISSSRTTRQQNSSTQQQHQICSRTIYKQQSQQSQQSQ